MKLTNVGLALLGVLAGGQALAAPVAVEREMMLQQLQALTQQIAVAQQQIDQSPNGRTQLGSALQLLNAAQNQIGEILRAMAAAPPAATASPGSQHGPQYGQPVPPQYGQPMPPQPQYGQPMPPQYGQPMPPQYGQPMPPQPQYGQPMPPQPQYGQPMPPQPQYGQPMPPAPPPPPQVNYSLAMNDGNFRALLQQLSGALSNDKLNQLRQGIAGNHFLVEQVAKILPLYVYTTDRVTALKMLAPVILDRHNGHRLLSLFQYNDDRDQAQRILNLAPPQ